jgi:NAD(P)H-hydrate epimerase
MKKYYGSLSVREADRIASDELGIPGSILMENAGRGAAEILLQRYPEASNFLILCGHGNNGGDGFVAARHLALSGRKPAAVVTTPVERCKSDVLAAALSARKSGIEIFHSERLTDEELLASIQSSEVVVDALLGTGAQGAPRGEVRRVMELCGKARRIAALDIPSGVDPDTGEIKETALKAELTVTFLALKMGLAVSPGSLHSGEVSVCGIGALPGLLLRGESEMTGYDGTDIPLLIPKIPKDAHKGKRGALMVIGGCDFFRGAPVLAAMGALKAGCGSVFLAAPDFMTTEAAALLPEAIFIPLRTKDGSIDFENLGQSIIPWLGKCGALVCGPGLGRSDGARKTVEWLCQRASEDISLLFDADALRYLADLEKNGYCAARRRRPAVITPHTGEAAYMLGTDSEKISTSRLSSCVELAKKFGVALLKGPHTLVCDGSGKRAIEKRVILEGGPQLAIPGSGDVLSGVVGAFLAAGMPPVDAATLGALVHASAGSGRKNGLLARDLVNGIDVSM